jgi:hypothetical protein
MVDMSRQKRSIIACSFLVFTSVTLGPIAQDDSTDTIANDPVLSYYWKRADATMVSGNPDQRGVSYSFVAISYYKKLGRLGAIEWSDSLSTAYYYSFGKLDSSQVRFAAKRDGIPAVSFEYPNVFADQYYLTDFPNDTGGQSLPIGFDTDTTQPTLPTGIALIDRNNFFPRWLYLHYPAQSGYRRYTRSFRFTVQDGFIFPDSIWEVASKDGLFYSTSYRLETRIDSLTIHR